MTDLAYVRDEMLPEKEPPASTVGLIGWMKANLFNGVFNSVLTLLALAAILLVASIFLPWAFQSTWSATSLKECRAIVGEGAHGACWGVVRDRWIQLMFGFYPPEQYWRPILAFALLFVALIPVLFNMISRRMNWVLLLAVLGVTFMVKLGTFGLVLGAVLLAGAAYLGFQAMTVDKAGRAEEIAAGAKRLPNPLMFTAIFPFVLPWLMWGGTIWVPVLAAVGFVVGFGTYRVVSSSLSSLFALILAVIAAALWWLYGVNYFGEMLDAAMPIGIEEVDSRKFGGFMLSILIGVVAIACSLPLGVVLALGRQSDLFIVKTLCVGFIEFIRGVPLITLLFVASVLLNIFLPPGTQFDIILRVLIMVTLFAAAYMAEVVRGGLAALPRGQYEAADALGLDYWKAQRLIIMPQALKISIPGIVSTFIGVFKDTVLVSIIGLLDPLGLSNAIRADANWNGIVWELYGFIALMFFIFCFSMSRYSMYLERKLQTGHN
ncbi:MAG: amino acid ABC transporter permease [Halocynthiibacter sp.]